MDARRVAYGRVLKRLSPFISPGADYNCLNLSATLTVLNLKIKHRDNKVYLILRLFAFFCLLQLDSRQILALSDLKLRF